MSDMIRDSFIKKRSIGAKPRFCKNSWSKWSNKQKNLLDLINEQKKDKTLEPKHVQKWNKNDTLGTKRK